MRKVGDWGVRTRGSLLCDPWGGTGRGSGPGGHFCVTCQEFPTNFTAVSGTQEERGVAKLSGRKC